MAQHLNYPVPLLAARPDVLPQRPRRIVPARIRGSSDAYESWNMYWI